MHLHLDGGGASRQRPFLRLVFRISVDVSGLFAVVKMHLHLDGGGALWQNVNCLAHAAVGIKTQPAFARLGVVEEVHLRPRRSVRAAQPCLGLLAFALPYH